MPATSSSDTAKRPLSSAGSFPSCALSSPSSQAWAGWTRFFTWSAVGAALWVGIVTLLGYVLGQALPI